MDLRHINERPNHGNFVGNTHTKEIHRLDHEDPKGNGCQVDKFIKSGHGVEARHIETMIKNEWSFCAKCFGEDMSEK
jgi:hypothetical protein